MACWVQELQAKEIELLKEKLANAEALANVSKKATEEARELHQEAIADEKSKASLAKTSDSTRPLEAEAMSRPVMTAGAEAVQRMTGEEQVLPDTNFEWNC